MKSFGQFVQELRKRQQLTLRGFCEKHGIDPGNQSKLERDLLPAPKSKEALETLARSLGLKNEAEEWQYFLDLAATSAGQLPSDIREDEEMASKLPLVFRSMRGEKLNEEQLRELADLLKRS